MAEDYEPPVVDGIRWTVSGSALGERGRATVNLCPGWHVESDRTHQGDGVAPCDRPGLHAVVELDVAVLEPIREICTLIARGDSSSATDVNARSVRQ